MRLALFGVASTIALSAAAPAFAADAASEVVVDPVTVLAARTEKPASEVPATISVITDKELEDRMVTDIRDLVKLEPGVSVRSSPTRFGAASGTTGRDGNSGFNIRGLEGDRVLIQIDGIRVPDGFSFGAQSVGRGDYQDLDLMKRVEILRGPASALYGSDGLAGAVSFTTKDPADYLPTEGQVLGGRVRAFGGSADDSLGATVVGAARHGRFSSMIAYTYREGHEQETQGKNDVANVDRTVANPQNILTRSVLGKLVFDVSDTNRIRLTAEHYDRDIETTVLTGIAKPPLATTSVIGLAAADDITRDRIMLDQRVSLDGGPIDRITWGAYWQKSETIEFSAEDRFTAVDRTRLNTFDNRVYGASVQFESHFDLGGITHKFIYGADGSKTRQEGIRDGTVAPAGETYPTRAFPNTDYTLLGAFVQDEIAFADGLVTLYPALRYDHYKLSPEADALIGSLVPSGSKDGRFSPKLGVVVKPTEEARLFFNYAQGFKAPSPSQVNNAFANIVANYRSIPNPDLKPETSEAFEAGARWVTTNWAVEFTAFRGEYKNFIEQIQIGGNFTPTNPATYQFVNLATVKIKGFEARGRMKLDNGFGAFAGLSYTEGNSYRPAKAPLDSVDPLKVVGGVSYSSPDLPVGGELTMTYSSRKSASDVAIACTPSCFRPAAFVVFDVTAWWKLTDQMTVRGGVFNLTDQKYAYWSDVRGVSSTAVFRDLYTQPGRNVSVSLSYDF